MKRLFILLITLALIGLFITQRAVAQSSVTYTETLDEGIPDYWDTEVGPSSAGGTCASSGGAVFLGGPHYNLAWYIDSFGWHRTAVGNTQRTLEAHSSIWRINLIDTPTLTSIGYYAYARKGSGVQGNWTVKLVGCNGSTYVGSESTNASAATHVSKIIDWTVTDIYVQLRAASHSPSEAFLDDFWVTTASGDPFNEEEEEEPVFYQPIQTREQVEVYTPVDEDTEEILAASRITALGDAVDDDLKENYDGSVQVYSAIPGIVGSVVQTSDSLYAVRIDGTGDAEGYTATYSNLATAYVLPGDTTTGGCVIGIAGPQFAELIEPIDTGPETNPVYKQIMFSVTAPDPEDELLGILQDWTVYANPVGSEICGSLLRYEDCINNNPQFREGGTAWRYGNSSSYLDNDPETGSGFVMLLGGQFAAQEIWLPVLETYYVTVASTPQGPDATLSVTIGDQTIEQVITPAINGTSVVTEFGPFTGMEPTIPGDIFTLKIQNEDSAAAPYGVYVNFVCMHIDGADARTPPAACYFSNPKFEEDVGWVLTGGASIESAPLVGGFLSMPDSSTAAQGIYLYPWPDAPGEYRITIMARQEGLIADIGGETILSSEIDTAAVDDTMTFNVHNTILMTKFVHEFEVADGVVADGDYILEVTGLDAGVDAIQIGEVCLEPVGGSWPGYGNAANTAPVCGSCTFPGVNLDPTIWLAWLGCLFTSFVCKIPAWIALITLPITSIFNFLVMIGRWFATVAFLFGQLLQGLISFVIAGIGNVLFGAINAVWAALMGLPFISNIVDRFALAGIIADALSFIVISLMTSILTVVHIMATFAQIAGVFLTSIMTALNGSGTVETGMPVCASLGSGDPLYPLCIGLDLSDLMMDVFPAINAWIYAAIGVLAYFTATHIFARVGQTFGDVS